MVCTEVPNQIKFVSRPHPTGSRTDFIYTDFEQWLQRSHLMDNIVRQDTQGLDRGRLASAPSKVHHTPDEDSILTIETS
jgi:hypothetical protein